MILSKRLLICVVFLLCGCCYGSMTVHHRNYSVKSHVIHEETLSDAQLSINCEAFMKPIKEKRDACLKSSQEEVDICVYFASDYNYLIPFLIHHLALGFSHIWIYNNDESVAWYRHPAILCMMAENYIDIQPWFGQMGLHKALDHCFNVRMPEPRKISKKNMMNVWGAVFDIDEMVVLHKDTCFSSLLKDLAAPSLAVNWAFFTPESPLTDFGRTGNVGYIKPNKEQQELIDYYNEYNKKNNKQLSPIWLPHDMLVRRMYENEHIKTITRAGCVDHFTNEHCPEYKQVCTSKYGAKPLDPQGKYINCGPWTPWVDNIYPIVQLNHYWTLSLSDFLRKIHRGKGGGYAKVGDQFRNTGEFFAHSKRPAGFVNDSSFLIKYGQFFNEMKISCPKCFDTSYFYLTK